jgi:hypothetical protein
MQKRFALCWYIALSVSLVTASPALAQFRPRPVSDPATGEAYLIEASASFWNTSSEMSISSEGLGIIGSSIDFKNDLGLEKSRFKELRIVLRPATKHKLRFEIIPIKMNREDFPLTRTIVFNGQAYPINARMNSQFDWTAYRFGYEYDFLTRDRWFVGLIFDIKQTNLSAVLETPATREFIKERGPLPALGGIARFYVVPNISLTGEFTRMPVKEEITDDVHGRYSDLNVYSTLNFTNNVGVQVGYRKFDVGYKIEDDRGAFKLNGLYFGIVARY